MTTQNEHQKTASQRNKEYYEKSKGFVVSIRLNGPTMEKFDQMTEQLQVGKSQLIRAVLDDVKIKAPNPKVNEELLIELKAVENELKSIGRNLNQLTQLAHDAHKGGLRNIGGLTSKLIDIEEKIELIKEPLQLIEGKL